jgi:predicted phosphodiesterase
MKYAIIADIHANLEALSAVLADIDAWAADSIVNLGDCIGYNAQPAACIDLLRRVRARSIAGNHDRAVCGIIGTDAFSRTATRAVQWTRAELDADSLAYLTALPLKLCVDGLFIAVHGALHRDKDCDSVRLDNDANLRASFKTLMAHPSGARLCAFAHTHRPCVFAWEEGAVRPLIEDKIEVDPSTYYLFNPGSVGQSRSSDRRATYVRFDTARRTLAIRRIVYDVDRARAKARAAGLLPPLWFLPRPARALLKHIVGSLGR